MKIAFFSNFLNHHQLPLCEEFCKKEGVEFVFVATEPISKDRLDMGYADMNKQYSFVLRTYEDDGEDKAIKIAEDFDVVIFGAAPLKYLDRRMQNDKLTFYFCERPLKKGYWRRFIPMTREKIKRAYIQYKNKPLYVLGASAYASYDFKLCGFDDKKCFKWGYFPQIEEKNIDDIIKAKRVNDRIKILYAGRLIKLKRVIDFVKAVNLIVKQGVVNFKFTIIGDGEEKNKIIKYINTNELSEFVEVFPFKPANEVRKEMDLADIYVFGSDFNEGWGAVVNEAMNSACAMVVSHAVGSAPYLIKNEQSGCIYRCGDVKQIKKIILKLLQQTEYRENLSKNAYETVLNHWSAKVAVDRFVEVCSKIEQKEYPYFQDGVCSYAELLKNNWIKKEK